MYFIETAVVKIFPELPFSSIELRMEISKNN